MSMTGQYLRVAPEVTGRIQRAPDTLMELLYPDPEPEDRALISLDIDKTWHVIHFLLNGDPWKGKSPLFEAVLGGDALTEEDLGYGPARYLRPAQVAASAEALQRISPEQLWSRYDDARVQAADIYWSNDDESKDYALENYEALQQFFMAAAKARDAMIIWLA
jgi:hypothetical protein